MGVVQSSSERDHNSDADRDSFRRLTLPWVEFQFFDEHSVGDLYRRVEDMSLSAVVYASNSLFSPAIFEASRAAAPCIGRAVNNGMGLVVLQQFLPPDVVRTCDFLPMPHQIEYRGVRDCHIKRVQVNERAIDVHGRAALTLGTDRFGTRSPTLWSEVKPAFRGEWRPIATVELRNTRKVDVILRSRTPRARLIVSALPLDWLADEALLGYVIARAVRSRGTLYLHPDGESVANDVSMQLAFGQAVLQGGHLSHHSIRDPRDVQVRDTPYRHFSHLLFSPRWNWSDLSALRSEGTKSRLENEGSITAHAGTFSDGHPLLVTVGGRPPYLEVADRFANWLEVNAERFRDAPTSPLRALAVAAVAIESAAADTDAVPRSMSVEEVRNYLRSYVVRRRQGRDNVDGHVLPTAAIASAMELLRFPSEEIAPLRSWIERGDYASSTASLQQALLWLPGLRLQRPRAVVRSIDKVYDDLLTVREEGHTSSSLSRLCAILSDGEAPISLRAIIAENLTEGCDAQTLARVAGSARTLQSDLEQSLDAGHPPLEAVCLIVATLIRIRSRSGLQSSFRQIKLEESQAQRTVDLRRDLESMKQHVADNAEVLAATQNSGRRFVGSLVVAAATILGLAFVLLLDHVTADLSTWIEIALPVLLTFTAMAAYLGARAARVGCEPRWLRAFRDFMQVGGEP
ncbi:hypothetical protein [Streptomyces sp. NPDC001422]|uniref:hypothetical protein n=1 Tax=Streptomyces sp. NPDC001422 TaxID=3364575 RepID=UPI003692558A